MEQLLVHCANAIETNNATLAQQILWVLNNTTPQDGDSNQRLAGSFIRALINRASKTGSCKMLEVVTETTSSYNNHNNLAMQIHKFSVIELADFVDLTPWHRFGFTAANSTIVEATKGFSVIHIVDLSLTHCMQIPTLIDSISNRDEVPPLIKLTVADFRNMNIHMPIPPLLDLSYDELGAKLVNFAKSKNVIMEFKAVSSTYADGFASLIEHLRVQVQHYDKTHEALVINCHMILHYIPDETLNHTNMNPNSSSSLRSMFLEALRSLDPTIVVLVDEDADLTSNDLVCRLKSTFNFLWIPYDIVDTFLPQGSKQREWYEASICWKIENVIAYEGIERVERVEPKSKWEQRMRNAHFQGICFDEDSILEVKAMLDEHAVGWGLKKEDEFVVLTWKGNNVIFASAWLPS
ncbi:SCARECROW-like protein 32-like [Trifolium pratense]|uniref:SCARECROW-like protein 32-like n=1 Tax=Trifolium pratense TaxID=57577 RepID=A0A2K3MVQ3_TRIPR|nr:SCARECROW-like protein 32-like [Trifolium pratense]